MIQTFVQTKKRTMKQWVEVTIKKNHPMNNLTNKEKAIGEE